MKHYWTGRGTLCSLDNSVIKQRNHTSELSIVDCNYCINLIRITQKPNNGRAQKPKNHGDSAINRQTENNYE